MVGIYFLWNLLMSELWTNFKRPLDVINVMLPID